MFKGCFGRTKEGQEASVYTIMNSKGMEAVLSDFGATMVSLYVKDKNGSRRDVILGYDNVLEYQKHYSYFGATVGRNCNRISGASIVIDDQTYLLDANDRGNNLHSGFCGFNNRIWSIEEQQENKIVFSVFSPHMDQGYPGNATVQVTYELTEENELAITYHAVSDKKTIFNMTNHNYYNLNGHDSGTVLNHQLQIQASHYTPIQNEKSIPTGEIEAVDGTPFDFRTAKTIGQDITADHMQIHFSGGYDHNFAIDKTKEGMEKVAVVYAKESGIRMEVYTDCMGIQLYTANGIAGMKGKGNVVYPNHAAFCLETQFFPNAINESNFVSPIVEANEPYDSKTVYRFEQ